MSKLLHRTVYTCRRAVDSGSSLIRWVGHGSTWRILVPAVAVAFVIACSERGQNPVAPLSPSDAGTVFGQSTVDNGTGACLTEDTENAGFIDPGSNGLNCTSQDVDIAIASASTYSTESATTGFKTLASTGGKIQCNAGDTVWVNTSAQVINHAQSRYDVGLWIGELGGSAKTGTSCLHFNLVEGQNNSTDLDLQANDACGDVAANVTVDVPLGTLKLLCADGVAAPDTSALVISACAGWLNSVSPGQRDGICPVNPPGGSLGFRYGTTPETSAKCKCEPLELPLDIRGSITIVKNTVGGNGTFAFTHDVGSNSTPTVPSPFNIVTSGGTGSQQFLLVPEGTYHITESAPPAGWSFTDLTCSAGGSVSAQTATITLAAGANVTCTYTNTKIPTLTLTKNVTNNSGGSANASAWTLSATGSSASFSGNGSPATGTTASLGPNNVTPGVQYTLAESGGPSGYSSTGIWSCDVGTFASPDKITLAAGQNATCTIVNDDVAAHLIIIKHVINDNGGTAAASAFTNTIGGVTAVGGQAVTGAESPGVNKTLSTVGAYTVTEGTHTGYAVSYSADCNATIALGETKTCTVTNDDIAAHLIVIKHVINDNGGTAAASAFTNTIGGVTAVGGQAVTGAESPGVDKTLSTVGAYTVTEGAHVGYAVTYSADCNGTIALGETKTCTVTNDDAQASLIIIKHVINDNGGTAAASAFTNTIGGVTAVGGQAVTGAESPGVTKQLSTVGAYTVTEGAHVGYAVSYSADCNATIALGETKTCTVTNDDIAAHLIIIKHVINDNGGTAVASAFTNTIGGVTAVGGQAVTGAESPGVDKTLSTVGAYTVTEGAHAGYDVSYSADCNGTIALDQTKTCTVTNDDQPAKLIVVKMLSAGSAGTSFGFTGTGITPSTFTLTPPTGGIDSVVYDNLSVGTKTVTEDVVANYILTDVGCDNVAGDLGTRTASVSLALGQTSRCVFINNQQQSQTTRTQGFWSTHSNIAYYAWFGGTYQGNTFTGVSDHLLCAKDISTVQILMGGFWSNIAKTSSGAKRSSIDQARMRLLQQLLAAELNNSAFGSSPTGTISIALAEQYFCTGTLAQIQDAAAQMAAFNESGDSGAFTPGVSANAKESRTTAVLNFWDVLP